MEKIHMIVDGYNVEVTPDENAFFVKVPALPGCCTAVDALNEVEAMVRDAKDLWISVARDFGVKVPDPQ